MVRSATWKYYSLMLWTTILGMRRNTPWLEYFANDRGRKTETEAFYELQQVRKGGRVLYEANITDVQEYREKETERLLIIRRGSLND